MIGCLVNGAEKGEHLADPKTTMESSPGEDWATYKAKSDRRWKEAIARLPTFDRARIGQIVAVLQKATYPISFESLRNLLGGPDSLVWSSTSCIGQKQTSTYSVASEALEYELVVDYEDSPIGSRSQPTMVARARLCYYAPFPLGWRFVAESTDDDYQVGAPKKKPNQSPEPTPGAVH